MDIAHPTSSYPVRAAIGRFMTSLWSAAGENTSYLETSTLAFKVLKAVFCVISKESFASSSKTEIGVFILLATAS